MPKFVVERALPGAGSLSGDDLRTIARRSNETLDGLAGRAQWLETFVTDNKLFCVYVADDEDTVREHGKNGGFPVDAVLQVRAIIDPSTGEELQ